MPVDEGESLSRSVQQIKKAVQDEKSAVSELGTGRDSIARDRLRRIRTAVQQCREKCKPIVSSKDPSLSALVDQYHKAVEEFEHTNNESLRKEKQIFRQADPNTFSASHLARNSAGQDQVQVDEIRPVDLTEFHTEEAIQREKLRDARDIETDVMDLRTTYQEFNSLVNQQQSGIDMIEEHVGESHSLIERGHGQLQQASRSQKRFRKVGCIIGIVLVLVIVVVIVVAVFASK